MPDNAAHVVVVGLMGVGKTTLATLLAEALGRPLSDTDDELSRLVGRDGAAVAATLGVPALHQLERGVFVAALARSEPQVIAPAASVIDNTGIRELLASVPVIHATADLNIIHARQAEGAHRRPMPIDELRALDQRRAPLFAEVADCVIDSVQPVEAMLAAALDHLVSHHAIAPAHKHDPQEGRP